MSSKIVYVVFCLFLFSCGEDEINTSEEYDYVIFGHFYGECIGEYCVELFKLEDGKLYEETNDTYPSSENPYDGFYVELSKDKFDLVVDLKEKIPLGLWEISDKVIGCPDCTDGGGAYLEVRKEGDVRYWMIDQMLNNIPDELHGLVKEINTKIALLQ